MQTEKSIHQFRENPQDFENSEAYFKMLVLNTVLQKELGMHYNPNLINHSGSLDFFADSKDIFLNGLLGEKHTGTCSTMPVLAAAVGRRLGYPLKLVAAKAHLFVRWESADGRERMNFDVSGWGLATHPDDYYLKWPRPISDAEISQGQYLKSLTPEQELAEFLVNRATCFEYHKHLSEAVVAYSQAYRLYPISIGKRLLLANAVQQLAPRVTQQPFYPPMMPMPPNPNRSIQSYNQELIKYATELQNQPTQLYP